MPHNRFYLFGEDLLREIGIIPVIDFFDRDAEPRLAAQVVVAKGGTARELLQAEFSGMAQPSEGAEAIILYLRSAKATVTEATLKNFLDRMEAEGIEPIAMSAELIPLEPDISIEGELTRKEIKSTARIGGTAVFKGNYLAGWLDDLETRGLNWIFSKVKNTLVIFPQPESESKLATVEIIRSTGKFKVEMQGGNITGIVEIDAVGNLGSVEEPIDLIKQPELWTTRKALKEQLKMRSYKRLPNYSQWEPMRSVSARKYSGGI